MTVHISRNELYGTIPPDGDKDKAKALAGVSGGGGVGGVDSVATWASGSGGRVLTNSPRAVSTPPPPSHVPDEAQIIQFYYDNSFTRYPVVDRNAIDNILSRPRESLDYWDSFLVNVVLAIGARYMELMIRPDQGSDMYYHRARVALSKAHFGNLKYAQACMLCAVYTHRAKSHLSGPTAWHLTGMAMRSAVKVGLHRRQAPATAQDPYQSEVNKRIFWSIYLLDRLLGHTLGRPFSIPEHDIDVPLPLNVDDRVNDPTYLNQLRSAQIQGKVDMSRITTMTSIIHLCTLRQIESQIQASIYSVNPYMLVVPGMEGILESRLDAWLKAIPDRSQLEALHTESYDYFLLNYYRAKTLLLSPRFNSLVSHKGATGPVLSEYAAISGGICQAYMALDVQNKLSYSPVSLQTLFIAGLSLAYITWLDPRGVGTTTRNDMAACLTMLKAIAGRWVQAEQYVEVFNRLMNMLSEPYMEPRAAMDPSIFKPLPSDWWSGALDFNLWDLSNISTV